MNLQKPIIRTTVHNDTCRNTAINISTFKLLYKALSLKATALRQCHVLQLDTCKTGQPLYQECAVGNKMYEKNTTCNK